ncbi:MAG: NrfD/PsrC family molybdoenzyme membrane anchor subunit [Gammaproteobacteria bacterium]|jgi:Ni/Fe-hydrogenase subunit HybB-like protein
MNLIRYKSVELDKKFFLPVILIFIALASCLFAFVTLEHEGHWLTGMNNQVVWGIPHVFAIFLIVSASGILNIASISSVFGVPAYKPLSRLSGLLAIGLLIGGLMVLVLDLGRPDRLIVAMTTFNFKSIFAWNIFLYTGFLLIAVIYLWMMFEGRFNKYVTRVGMFAYGWRIILTTGTGSIFGFLVAKEAYDSAMLAPLFIAMSLLFGTAIFIQTIYYLKSSFEVIVGEIIFKRLRKLLLYFILAVLYFTILFHLTNLYATTHHDYEFFLLLSGNVYTYLFWIGQILLGTLLPLYLVSSKRFENCWNTLLLSSFLIIFGGFIQLYVIIISGQAFPLDIFPGFIENSTFGDGEVARYIPSIYEFMLGLGGIAIASAVFIFGILILEFVPDSLKDEHLQNK